MGGSEKDVLLKTIRGRRSIRSFDGKHAVSDRQVKAILEAARWAPSARNLQPLEYLVIRDPARRRKLAVYCRQDQPAQTPVAIVVIGDLKRARSVGDVSPHDTTTHWKGIKKFIYQDAAAAIQNMLLMAHALGLGSLWIGSFDRDALEDFIGLDPRFTAIAVICVGKQSKERSVPPKRPLNNIMHVEAWSRKRQDERYMDYSNLINTPLEDDASKRSGRRG